MKKTIFAILALCLALVTAFLMPVQAVGANVGTSDEFIKEVRIGYGEEGKAKLEAEGYTVWQGLDANKDGTGSSVYLGYITTTVKEEAITDFAVMPMGSDNDRDYSFEAYQKEMEHISSQIDEMVNGLDKAILEFRANYKKDAPYNEYANIAYKLLEMYTEDDTGRTLADLFVNGTEADKTTYHNIFMMGNSTAVTAVKIALAIGCTEAGGETFLDRLSVATKKEINQADNDKVNALANTIEAFKEELNTALATYKQAESYNGGIEGYIAALEDDKTAYGNAICQISLIEIMKDTKYGTLAVDNKPLSFLDAMLLPTKMQNEDDLALDDEVLYMLISSMTEGQSAVAGYVGLGTLIRYAYSTTIKEETTENGTTRNRLDFLYSLIAGLEQNEKVSVYLGVDRTVFSDYKTVAITDEAIRSNTLGKSLGTTSNYNNSSSNAAKIALIALSATTGAASIGLGVYSYLNWNKATTVTGVLQEAKNAGVYFYFPGEASDAHFFEGTFEDLAREINAGNITKDGLNPIIGEVVEAQPMIYGNKTIYTTSIGTKITLAAGAICAVASIVLGILAYLQKSTKPVIPKVTYTQIPRAIIDVKRNSYTADQYFVYYAAKSVNLPAGYEAKEESTALYGDLNGLNEVEEWLCLYYAKDMRLGSPLTADIYLSKDGSIPALKQNKYVPIHDFCQKDFVVNDTEYAPYNLNGTSGKQDAAEVYVFFKRNLSYKAITASVIDDTDFNWLAVVTFVSGAVLAGVAAWFIAKKKYKKKTEETI